MNDDIEITPEELLAAVRGDDPPVLLDVRKPWEFGYCHIEGSVLIPLDALQSRLTELDRQRAVITICHVGMRSLMAAEYLKSSGFQARSLEGGIDLWAERIDPSMARY
jgi:rhodanese-related sulfurtransferase